MGIYFIVYSLKVIDVREVEMKVMRQCFSYLADSTALLINVTEDKRVQSGNI
jgi:hypothetical protein